MAYVKGTVVELVAVMVNKKTGLPVTTSAGLSCLVRQPDGTTIDTTSTISPGAATGEFVAMCDTGAGPAGVWEYQFTDTSIETVVKRSSFNVRAAIAASA